MPISLRSLAATDIDSALAYYRTQAGQDIAHDFISHLESALDHIKHHPLTGSLRFAYELEIPDLRSWTLPTFPYMIFYITNETDIEVWRVLHAKRDIPGFLIQDQTN
jgi:toxin ParE1/3/4